MERDFAKEIDSLKNEISEIKAKIIEKNNTLAQDNENNCIESEKNFYLRKNDKKTDDNNLPKGIYILKNIYPDKRLDDILGELCEQTRDKNTSGMVSHLGVFCSNDKQFNWIRSDINIDDLLNLVENKTLEKVLNCIGNRDRLNILLSILKKPMSVVELVNECKLNSTGQAYHHMKPLLAADLIIEDTNNNKGVYTIQSNKVKGIIMMLAGISDIVGETYSKGDGDDN